MSDDRVVALLDWDCECGCVGRDHRFEHIEITEEARVEALTQAIILHRAFHPCWRMDTPAVEELRNLNFGLSVDDSSQPVRWKVTFGTKKQ